jgi:hypothetical protein
MDGKKSSYSIASMQRWNAILAILMAFMILDGILIVSKDTSSLISVSDSKSKRPLRNNQVSSDRQRSEKQGENDMKEAVSPSRDSSNENENEYESQQHKVAGLSCKAYGGPPDEDAAEMVYWQDIPSDSVYVSPLKDAGPKVKYLTFEPDEGERDMLQFVKHETMVDTNNLFFMKYYRRVEQHSYVNGNSCYTCTCYRSYTCYAA